MRRQNVAMRRVLNPGIGSPGRVKILGGGGKPEKEESSRGSLIFRGAGCQIVEKKRTDRKEYKGSCFLGKKFYEKDERE